MIEEKTGDLLNSGFPIAHCVAQDLEMGAGVALAIRRKYISINEMKSLKTMDPKIGDCLVQNTSNGYIFHLITKPSSRKSRPTIDDFVKTCESWFHRMKELGIKSCNIPRLGCGLDRLKWDSQVKPVLEKMVSASGISLIVWNFPIQGNVSIEMI